MLRDTQCRHNPTLVTHHQLAPSLPHNQKVFAFSKEGPTILPKAAKSVRAYDIAELGAGHDCQGDLVFGEIVLLIKFFKK